MLEKGPMIGYGCDTHVTLVIGVVDTLEMGVYISTIFHRPSFKPNHRTRSHIITLRMRINCLKFSCKTKIAREWKTCLN